MFAVRGWQRFVKVKCIDQSFRPTVVVSLSYATEEKEQGIMLMPARRSALEVAKWA